MERHNRPISLDLVIERKAQNIDIRMPETGYKETFDNEDDALETTLFCMLEAFNQIKYNILDLMKEKPDKMQLAIESIVISEIN